MTKQEIARHISSATGLSAYDALRAATAFIDACKLSLANGSNIYLRGFGTIHIVTRKAKKVQDFHAGTTISLPAQKSIKFVKSKHLIIK